MNSLTNLAKNSAGQISANSPIILTGFAVTGLITTTILAVRATPKAMGIVVEEECERIRQHQISGGSGILSPLGKFEVVKLTWKLYIPAAGVGVTTILCILGVHSVHSRRSAALASVYTITDTAFREYKSKVVETIGKNKELAIRDEVSADRIKANPSGANEVIFTGKGDNLCYDSLTGRYFKSDIEKIRRSVNVLNKRLMNEMFITLNELYYELGLASTILGESLGWNIDKGLLDISFSTTLDEDGTPCLVLNYDVSPKFI
jgi:Family of unknown function (DUF6353)